MLSDKDRLFKSLITEIMYFQVFSIKREKHSLDILCLCADYSMSL